MQTSLSSFLVPTPSPKNGQANTCHLSDVDGVSPKQRHWEALERNNPGRKKSKLRSGSGHVLRKDAHLLVCSMVYNMIFYPLSHLVVTAALESRCHYSYFTVEKGGTKVGQWTCMSHMRSRERNQPQDTPAMPLPPWVQEVRKAAAP